MARVVQKSATACLTWLALIVSILSLPAGCEQGPSAPLRASDGDVDGDADADRVAEPNLPCTEAKSGVKLVFAGDVVLGGPVGALVEKDHDGDYGFLFEQVSKCLNKADVVFANLESVASLAGEPKTTNEGAVLYRADPKSLTALKNAGVDVVSLANDHVFDYGREGLEDSFNRITGAGLSYVGAGNDLEEAQSPVIFAKGGIKIAFVAFSFVGSSAWAAKTQSHAGIRSGISWGSVTALESTLYKVRDTADFVVVSMHFGTPYSALPDNSKQDALAHLAIERGADLVIGHHPHVLQPVMVYLDKHIAFSLGSFISAETKENANKGMLLEVNVSRGGKIENVYRRTFNINEQYQPVFN
jgi:poly-gamma-glutamate capsule biosynthesis protein CapA/YwtB (metallophosphatase superfamily)